MNELHKLDCAVPTIRAASWLRLHWRALLVGVVALLGLAAWVGWEVFGLHVDDPMGYTSASAVKDYIGIPPPASAIHIHTAGYEQGMEFSHFVRFEAPVGDCVAYAQKVAHGMPPTADGVVRFDRSLISYERSKLPNSTWFDLFDLPDTKNIVGADPGAKVWVDQSRGVFYFYEGF